MATNSVSFVRGNTGEVGSSGGLISVSLSDLTPTPPLSTRSRSAWEAAAALICASSLSVLRALSLMIPGAVPLNVCTEMSASGRPIDCSARERVLADVATSA